MANTIYCDWQGCQSDERPGPKVATWLVSRLDGTFNQAYCDVHYATVCGLVWQSAQETEEATEPAAEAATQPGPDDPTDEDEAADQAALERVTASSPRVVKRGTSPSRRAHEARKRARAQAAEPAPAQEPSPEAAEAAG